MLKCGIWTLIFALGCVLLETALLSNIMFLPAMPDILLLLTLYVSFYNGPLFGECTGFLSGLMLDFLSASPFGLNALIRTIIGFAAGSFKEIFSSSRLLIPFFFGFCGTWLKLILYFLLSILYPGKVFPYDLFTAVFWTELALNTLLAPVFFLFFSLFSPVLVNRLESDKYTYGK